MNKGEKTRQFIIEKTAPIFNVKGYAGTSLSDMTEATGLTKGSIYGHFANKDEVALAAFDYNLQQVMQTVRREMEQKNTIREKLAVFIAVYNNFLKQPLHGGCPILNTAVEADDTHPALRKKAADAIHNWKKMLVQLIETGIKQQDISPTVHAEQLALTIIATIEGAMMISKLTGKPAYHKLIMASVENMVKYPG
ncbi:TetR/AcrR family transcriptional regulator [Chitinophaga sp. XS-30]|uniref:TetR/AcrR family transcriptional regulator n=1 Tax=Chitinophaga sp. XS-30 TaxID=2604421 RepID=UPI0011DC8090|nr:TetR/AcrR family transcriptional regulator [Chitinophaga sp. XS-30]QEH42887.1 TetR/AcrR family transcriptional regulator [Chitinophaga sp. XS-30]